ncbi:hypothetical protein AVEN_84892-1 [Araneus ventricosus]|uniref:Uncharacterized protein n=1 Tax=Araneus ventricosus TaxID=182803 RepID=A0A4Y2BUS9_ARAVE|nr:hypothetical protein AVEN_80538-1 [Araneus ventricosus]GBL95693.1 hypothetical protein AVEN_84892-1 [Araneus ventricosus]
MLGLEYGPSLGKLYGQHGLELKKILGAEKAIAWPHLYYYPILTMEKEHEIGFGKEIALCKQETIMQTFESIIDVNYIQGGISKELYVTYNSTYGLYATSLCQVPAENLL